MSNGTSKSNVRYALDLLEDGMILGDTHTKQLVTSVVLVQSTVGVFSELLHVRPNEHLTQFHEVAMILVVDLNDTPWVRASTNDAAIFRLDFKIGADHSERNLGDDGLMLAECLLIFVLVHRSLEDPDVVVLNVRQNLETR